MPGLVGAGSVGAGFEVVSGLVSLELGPPWVGFEVVLSELSTSELVWNGFEVVLRWF